MNWVKRLDLFTGKELCRMSDTQLANYQRKVESKIVALRDKGYDPQDLEHYVERIDDILVSRRNRK